VFRSPCIKFSPVASPSKCGKSNKHHNVANRRRSSDEKDTRTINLNEYDHIFSQFVFSFRHDTWLLNRILRFEILLKFIVYETTFTAYRMQYSSNNYRLKSTRRLCTIQKLKVYHIWKRKYGVSLLINIVESSFYVV